MKKSLFFIRFLFFISVFCYLTTPLLGQEEGFDALIRKAIAYQSADNYSLALQSYEKAFLATPDKNVIHYYNAACCASLIGEHVKAIQLLTKSVDLGYIDLFWLKNDQDFNSIRTKEEWQLIIKKIENKKSEYEKQFAPFDSIPLTDFIPFTKDNKWGYLHRKTKQVLVKPQFFKASFAGSCLVVWTSPNSYFCINNQRQFFVQRQNVIANRSNRNSTDGELVDVFMEMPPVPAIPIFPKVDSTEGFKGFKMDRYNNIISASSIFDQYRWLSDYDKVIPEITQPMKIGEEWFAIAGIKENYGLISEKGVPHAKLGFKYKRLYAVEQCKDAKWFIFRDDKDKCGFVNLNGEVKFYGLVEMRDFTNPDHEERFNFMLSSSDKGSFLINLKTLNQVTDFFNGELLEVDYTYKSDQCFILKPQLKPEQVIAFYFLIKDANGMVYYLGENKEKYLIK